MDRFKKLFNEDKFIIGMVHLLPLPGTCGFDGDMDAIYEQALNDAKALEEGGVNALMVENFNDMPYGKTISLEQATALAAVSAVIKKNTKLPVGIDAALCDYKAALSSAKAARADFVRLAVFVDTVQCFAGIIEPCCSLALPYRKQLQGEDILIFADVQVKHTHMVIKDIDIVESAKVAQDCGADAIIVTGLATGLETPIESVIRVKNNVKCPVIIGSGINPNNIKKQLDIADGAIVGSSLKTNNKIDINKVRELMDKFHE